jgi:hypothetical protein
VSQVHVKRIANGLRRVTPEGLQMPGSLFAKSRERVANGGSGADGQVGLPGRGAIQRQHVATVKPSDFAPERAVAVTVADLARFSLFTTLVMDSLQRSVERCQ